MTRQSRALFFLTIIFACLFIFFGIVHKTHANAGDLDPSFDLDGKLTTDFAAGTDLAWSVIIQPDGKIVAAGSSVSFSGSDFALARYDPDGSLDPTFGSGGIVITDFAGGGDAAQAAALQADGKIIVVGTSTPNEGSYFALARYNANGSLDPTFGSGGLVITGLGGAYAKAVAVQPDGKIVVAGIDRTGANQDFAVLRYDPDGKLDATFGSGGLVTTDFGGDEQANAVALQSDSKIVVTGLTNSFFAIARYNPNGSLDSTFGSGGLVITDFPNSVLDLAEAVLVQPDNKIIAAGFIANPGISDFALARYNPDGSLDSTFGSGGLATTNFSINGRIRDAVLQPNGKIVAVGDTNNTDFAVVRFNPNGSLDPLFGSGGVVITDFAGDWDAALTVAIQPDDKIVAAGFSSSTNNGDFALARYEGCAYADDFEDGILATNWTYVKPFWSETGGELIGTPIGKKAEAIAAPVFAGCSLCSVRATMQTAGGTSNKLSLLGWFQDKNNNVEVLMKEEDDQWVVRQHAGGVVVRKMKASATILPNVFYDVQLGFDGTMFTLIIDGITLASMPAPKSVPNGTVGFRVKNTTGRFGSICVELN